MIKNSILLSLIVFSLLVSSCSNLIYYSEEIHKDLNKNNIELKKVQFYNSHKIVIKRHLTKDEIQIAEGTIIFENGQYYEEIIIPKNTKGIAVSHGSEYLKIAFEIGENKNLRFSLNDNEQYQISANSWDNDFGCVVYDSTKYFIIPKSSNTVLLVNKEYTSNYEKTRRILEGRSVE